jgi:peptide chain release factor subunit 3
VKSWTTIQAKIKVAKQICLEKHEMIEQMGRFTLRDEGKTIAIGKVLKYKPA